MLIIVIYPEDNEGFANPLPRKRQHSLEHQLVGEYYIYHILAYVWRNLGRYMHVRDGMWRKV